MNAGLLKEQIRIIYEDTLTNPYGEKRGVWKEKYKTRARVMNDSGSRAVENDEIVYLYNKTFQIRSYVPIVETDRILWDSKHYKVLTIEHRKEYNDIIVKTELVNE